MPFDLQTDHYNKEGKIIRRTPYRCNIVDGVKLFERPIGSGIWYNEDGTIAKDESAAILKQQEADELAKAAAQEQEKQAAKEKLREEIRAELLAEQAAQKGKSPNGSGSKG